MKSSPEERIRSWSEEGPALVRTRCEGSGHLYRYDKGSEDLRFFRSIKTEIPPEAMRCRERFSRNKQIIDSKDKLKPLPKREGRLFQFITSP